jgi:hypothetical protein
VVVLWAPEEEMMGEVVGVVVDEVVVDGIWLAVGEGLLVNGIREVENETTKRGSSSGR